jgi:hypothetical protein
MSEYNENNKWEYNKKSTIFSILYKNQNDLLNTIIN